MYNNELFYKTIKRLPFNMNIDILDKIYNYVIHNENCVFLLNTKGYDTYIYTYMHLCNLCFQTRMYYYNLKFNKFPLLRTDKFKFIYMPHKFVPDKIPINIINDINKKPITKLYNKIYHL